MHLQQENRSRILFLAPEQYGYKRLRRGEEAGEGGTVLYCT